MGEHGSHDFMNVDSFAQLPFIRPSPKTSSSPVRLFGYDFPQSTPSKETSQKNATTATAAADSSANGAKENVTGQKFECHYCSRNFPTSQALGGHQNAHKRERQQAKRAHLQSAMAAAHASHHHHHHAAATAEGHVYGILNYHRLPGSIPTVQHGGPHNHSHRDALLGIESPTGPPPHYPSWTAGSGVGTWFYGGLGTVSQPINGNPIPGLWMVQRENNWPVALPLVEARPVAGLPVDGAISLSSSSSPSSSNSQGAKDQNVSLDLHL